MKINMTPILNSQVTQLEFDGTLSQDISLGINIVSSSIKGKIKNTAGYMALQGEISIEYTHPCDRCLVDKTFTLNFEFDAPVAVQGSLSEENDDYLLIQRDILDITERLEEEIYIELPERHLCNSDCRGLCHKCGRDMNEIDRAECGCAPKEVDPKWEKIKMMLEE